MVDDATGGDAEKVRYGFKPQSDGTVTLIVSKGTVSTLQLSINIEELAGLAAAALNSARVASELSGKKKEKLSEIDKNIAGPVPDQMGIAMGPGKDQVALVSHFGAAVFALPFKKGEATTIAYALLAAGAGGNDAN